MSILDAFDPNSKPLFTPEQLYETKTKEQLAEICIVSIHHKVRERVLEEYRPAAAARAFTANGPVELSLLEHSGRHMLFYMSPIGAPAAGAILHEAAVLTGAKKFIVFGSCGVLSPETCAGKVIVPTEAYRDEGLSYHFAPAADYIRMRGSSAVAEHLSACGIPYVTGRTWTTDAVYRETANLIARHRAEGCLCVEMEAAGLQAVADAIGAELFVFFFGGDILGEVWDKGALGGDAEKARQHGLLDIALGLAARL